MMKKYIFTTLFLFLFFVNSFSQLKVLNNGFVGIGTNNPQCRLQVEGTEVLFTNTILQALSIKPYFYDYSVFSTTTSGFKFLDTDSKGITINLNNSNYSEINTNNYGFKFLDTDSKGLILNPNNSNYTEINTNNYGFKFLDSNSKGLIINLNNSNYTTLSTNNYGFKITENTYFENTGGSLRVSGGSQNPIIGSSTDRIYFW